MTGYVWIDQDTCVDLKLMPEEYHVKEGIMDATVNTEVDGRLNRWLEDEVTKNHEIFYFLMRPSHDLINALKGVEDPTKSSNFTREYATIEDPYRSRNYVGQQMKAAEQVCQGSRTPEVFLEYQVDVFIVEEGVGILTAINEGRHRLHAPESGAGILVARMVAFVQNVLLGEFETDRRITIFMNRKWEDAFKDELVRIFTVARSALDQLEGSKHYIDFTRTKLEELRGPKQGDLFPEAIRFFTRLEDVFR